jgi:hypothetical protein
MLAQMCKDRKAARTSFVLIVVLVFCRGTAALVSTVTRAEDDEPPWTTTLQAARLHRPRMESPTRPGCRSIFSAAWDLISQSSSTGQGGRVSSSRGVCFFGALRCLSDHGREEITLIWSSSDRRVPPPAEDRPAMMTKPGSQHEEVVTCERPLGEDSRFFNS